MKNKKYLIDKEYLLSKFDGKGGWTYTRIPEIKQNPKNNFGWVMVNGFIDNHEVVRHKLMPMGDGSLFLSLNAKLRKILKKESGDSVRVRFYIEETLLVLTAEIISCFENEQSCVLDNYNKLESKKQQSWLDYIYKSYSEQIKADRIVEMILDLQ